LTKGETQYNSHCASCHGNNTARVTSIFPDLRYAGPLWSAEAFKAIVIDGVLQPNGMVSFRQVLTPEDAESIRAYVVHIANQAKASPPTLPRPPSLAGQGGTSPTPAATATPALHQ
jgi:quinohemoprotein ethanol dehydrogenase